jgi:transcriptional regulator GlxA family with amidase domain
VKGAEPRLVSFGSPANDGKVPDSRLSQVLEAIEQNPTVDVTTLARLVNLSPSRLQHLFREHLGMAIRDVVAEHKLRKAALLVVSTDMRIKEITFKVGYEHSSSFVRAFRKRFLTAPQTYRRKQLNPVIDTRGSRIG